MHSGNMMIYDRVYVWGTHLFQKNTRYYFYISFNLNVFLISHISYLRSA